MVAASICWCCGAGHVHVFMVPMPGSVCMCVCGVSICRYVINRCVCVHLCGVWALCVSVFEYTCEYI